jgi:5-deoxy-glucuronate isomerase
MPNPRDIPPQVFRRTNAHEGLKEFFSPETGASQYLTYARFVAGPKVGSHLLKGDGREWSLFCIKAPATVKVNGETIELNRYDILYLPRHTDAELSGPPGADIALGGSPAHADFPLRVIRYEEIRKQPEFCIDVGSVETGTKRTIYNMLGSNIPCSRLLSGFTVGTPGAWTSWPPHEHNDSKEELYLFFDMPEPGFSVQFVYPDRDHMKFAEVVRDGDCVMIPYGYHPTAAAPGNSTVFHWVMAAYDPEKHRDLKYGINIQPDYQNVKFL